MKKWTEKKMSHVYGRQDVMVEKLPQDRLWTWEAQVKPEESPPNHDRWTRYAQSRLKQFVAR
jgi:hypothetical protein